MEVFLEKIYQLLPVLGVELLVSAAGKATTEAEREILYCEIKGFGATADAHHIIAPPSDPRVQARAISTALEKAGVDPEEIDYILDRAKAVAQEHGIPIETVMASFGLSAAKGGAAEAGNSAQPPAGAGLRAHAPRDLAVPHLLQRHVRVLDEIADGRMSLSTAPV
jgi:hypothetical protein